MSHSPHAALPHFSFQALPPGTRLGLAVSGGADSVALLRLAHRLASRQGWTLRVLHVQHGLRADASAAEEAFVQALAAECFLPCDVLPVDTAAVARDQRLGLEEAGRLLRYGWFRKLLLDGELDVVATGHTLDDQAETVLAKLLRGAWTAGLSGIHAVIPASNLPDGFFDKGPNKGYPATQTERGTLIRPLLHTRGAELRRWLRSIGQPWCEDASNTDPQFTRNRIRHQLMPILTEFNPQVTEQLAQISTLAREDESYWQGEVSRVLPGLLLPGRPVRGGGRASSTLPNERSLAIEVERLRAFPAALQRRLLRATAEQLGVFLRFSETERIWGLVEGPVGSTARREQLTTELRVERTPREVRFLFEARASEPEQEVSVAVPGEGTGFGVRIRLMQVSGQVQPAATLRAVRPSDRVQLRYSSGGPKKVKEVLERIGIPAPDRGGWPLLEWQGEVIWLRGAVLEPTPLSSQISITVEDLAEDLSKVAVPPPAMP